MSTEDQPFALPERVLKLSPTPENLQQRVQQFVDDNYKKLYDLHSIHDNTVHYHRCCNTFTTKRSAARKGHTSSETFSQFLGKPKKETSPQVMVEACVRASRTFTGSLQFSSPTFKECHQDRSLLDKRIAKAEEEAAEYQTDAHIQNNILKLRIEQMMSEKQDLAELIHRETRRASEYQRVASLYSFFLKYNGIDPEKVLQGWSPVGGQPGETIKLRWPGFDLDKHEKFQRKPDQ